MLQQQQQHSLFLFSLCDEHNNTLRSEWVLLLLPSFMIKCFCFPTATDRFEKLPVLHFCFSSHQKTQSLTRSDSRLFRFVGRGNFWLSKKVRSNCWHCFSFTTEKQRHHCGWPFESFGTPCAVHFYFHSLTLVLPLRYHFFIFKMVMMLEGRVLLLEANSESSFIPFAFAFFQEPFQHYFWLWWEMAF